jgi:uncharacterized membrane protein YdbT with pleckstrin-like domain
MNFMNSNWRAYLKSGDKVSFYARVNESIVLFRSILIGLLVFAFAYFFAFCAGVPEPLAALSVPVALVAGALCYARSRSFHFALTQSGVYSIGGLFVKSAEFVAYSRITDATIRRGIPDQIFGAGSIGISTAGGAKLATATSQPYEIVISSVSEYQKFRQEIFKKMK